MLSFDPGQTVTVLNSSNVCPRPATHPLIKIIFRSKHNHSIPQTNKFLNNFWGKSHIDFSRVYYFINL